MTPPQRMSTEIQVDVMAREAIGRFYSQWPEEEQKIMNRHNWLVEQVAIAISEAVDIVRHQYETTDLTIAIQERMEFKDQRDALIAAKPGERVKAWNEALEKVKVVANGHAASYDMGYQADLAGACRFIVERCNGFKLPEAQPVEPKGGVGPVS